MKPTLFIGDLNVDIVMSGLEGPIMKDKEIICERFQISMGSSAVFSACHYSRLGGDAHICGLAGNDGFGTFVLNGLKKYNVNTDLVQKSDCTTGITVNLLEGRARSQITFPGTIEKFKGSSIIIENLSKFQHLHFSGVYLQHSLRPGIAEILRKAKNEGLTVSLDPQWDNTEKWELMDDWLPILDYLFLNEDEALSLSKSASVEDAYIHLKKLTSCPLIKVGARGVYYNGRVYPPVDVPVVDTTGAGDTFSAAFLYSLLCDQTAIEDALQRANAEASDTCTFIGGVPDGPVFL